MMTFINSRDDATTKNLVEVDDNVDIYDTFEAFVGFLQACTYNNSVIYHGLVEAVAKMEEMMECDAGTYEDEIKIEHGTTLGSNDDVYKQEPRLTVDEAPAYRDAVTKGTEPSPADKAPCYRNDGREEGLIGGFADD